MRNYWNQLACFKYFTHSKIVKCEIKHQLSSKSGKLHKITKASFLLVFISSPWKTFLPTLLSYQTPLLLPRCTSKTVKAISQCCYFLLLSFIGRRNTHTYLYVVFKLRVASKTLWNISALQIFLSRHFYAVILQL